jgi:hypothetical protein
MAPLYANLLGKDFRRLCPALRRFHGCAHGGVATGIFRVTRGRGWLRSLLATIAALPPAGDAVAVTLRVTARGGGELWDRSFGAHRLATRQAAWRDLLLEYAGPVCFGLEPSVRGGGLRFRTRRVWVLGLPVPFRLAPTVDAALVPGGDGWSVRVRARVPVLGELLSYEGKVDPR